MLILLLFVLVFILCFIKIILIGRKNYGTLENCGFPVISPTLFLGSIPDFYKKIAHDEDIIRAKKYGPIWGLYEGTDPQVHICDPDLVKQIHIKDFDFFHSRRQLNLGPIASEILDLLQGNTWKLMRSTLSPLFTTSKLKWANEFIDAYFKETNQELVERAHVDGKRKIVRIDAGKSASAWFINMFGRATLGIDFDNYKDIDNDIANAFREMMGEKIKYSFLHSIVFSFPVLESVMSPLLDDKPQILIDKTMRGILSGRQGVRRNNDLADILNDLWNKNDEELKTIGITRATLVSQALAFFVGGYDSSHTTVVHLLYFLGKYPETQAKLYKEIIREFPNIHNDRVTHDKIQDVNMPYLLACLNESLRMGPSFFRPERICNKDWSYKGYTIKKGTAVMVATWGLHFNPEYFPDPYTFNPERFMPENKDQINPYCFTPFGHGPRACIGMRFAYESMKVFMTNMIGAFEVNVCPETKLTYKPGNNILAHIDEPVLLDLTVRE